MRLVLKLGGTLLENEAGRAAIAGQIAAVARNHELVVVHGGGKQVTRVLEEQGTASRFVNGLRVSDQAVIDAVTKVIAGEVNKRLVSALLGAGVPALGLSGVDGRLTSVVQLNPDLGFVGKPIGTDGGLLTLLRDAGHVPVVACIAADSHGTIYNVNADEMAVSCAIGWRADRLVFLTDVPGVKNEHGEVISTLTRKGVTELFRSGSAHGGMRAKLEAAVAALEQGLSEVTIAPGHEHDICVRLLAGEPVGTRLRSEREPAGSVTG
ncbi:MAG: acetylglutamate kinase [Bryobacteraceae bacterium]